jgi:hypothetical protein
LFLGLQAATQPGVELYLRNIVFGGFDRNTTDKLLVVFQGEFDEFALLSVKHFLLDLKVEAELVIPVEDVDKVFKEIFGVLKQDGDHFLVLLESTGGFAVEHLSAEGDDDGVSV